MRTIPLLALLVVCGCYDPNALKDEIDMWNDRFTDSDSSSVSGVDSAGDDSGDESDSDGSTAGEPNETGEPPSEVEVALSTNTDALQEGWKCRVDLEDRRACHGDPVHRQR
ncbi:MAG: hypothetical protein ACPG4T_02940 [Nannocystaceae bacterium]